MLHSLCQNLFSKFIKSLQNNRNNRASVSQIIVTFSVNLLTFLHLAGAQFYQGIHLQIILALNGRLAVLKADIPKF